MRSALPRLPWRSDGGVGVGSPPLLMMLTR